MTPREPHYRTHWNAPDCRWGECYGSEFRLSNRDLHVNSVSCDDSVKITHDGFSRCLNGLPRRTSTGTQSATRKRRYPGQPTGGMLSSLSSGDANSSKVGIDFDCGRSSAIHRTHTIHGASERAQRTESPTAINGSAQIAPAIHQPIAFLPNPPAILGCFS